MLGRRRVRRRGNQMRRPILFYSAWPLGYHNLEAERKARALEQAGYDVLYVAGVGIRNPSLANVPKLLDRGARALRRARSNRHSSRALPRTRPRVAPCEQGVPREGAVIVAPPRQLAPMRRLNAVWLARQLRRQLGPWEQALAWIRWPTPELVDALASLRPARVVYEAVDAYEATPGIVGRWAPIFERCERALVWRADAVVVPGERLAERYRALGANVHVIPHGVDLGEWHGGEARAHEPVVAGFLGTIDARLDVAVLREVASAHPEWRLRLVGPVQDGFDRRELERLPNVVFEPPVPAERVPETLSGFDLGLMPYVKSPNTEHMTPVKNLEYLAAGIPAVARRVAALEPFSELLYFADSPRSFVEQLERALAEQTPERAERRRAVAEQHAWPLRLAEATALADELTGGPRCVEAGPAAGRAG